MNMIFLFFKIIASLISVYSLIILIRILLTWFPGAAGTPPGRLLAAICDPFLLWFRRFHKLRTAHLDFTPILAMGVLMLLSAIFSNFANNEKISLGITLGTVLKVLWSFTASLLTFLNIFLIIRIIFLLFIKNSGSHFWQQLDNVISPLAYKICGIFFPRKFIQYKTVLLTALVFCLIAEFAGGFLFSLFINLLFSLPF